MRTRSRARARRGVRSALAVVAPLTLVLGCSPARVERVVLVTIDTLRADHVGSYGGPPTPTLDAIAEQGVRFATAIAPTPITLPSHTSLLTGLDPPRHGVRNNSTFRLPDDVPTLSEHMRQAGFATGAFVGAVVLDRQYGLARGFDSYDDQMSARRAAGVDGFAERTADRVIDAVLAWLDDAPERFFVWVHLYDPHADYVPPPSFRARFANAPYDGEIAFADRELGRLLRRLDERFGAGGTLVVVTSDHGESLGEHGEYTHSLTLYDATQRVPLLMRGPGVPRGTVVDGVVRTVDVAPTILALAGAPPLAVADGTDLEPAFGGAPLAPRFAYLETLATQLDYGWSPMLGVRSTDFKYVRAPRRELYELAADPGETRNVVEARRDVAADLDRRLMRMLAGGRPVMPTVTPDEEARGLLESLGYVVTAPRTQPRFGLGRVGGVDPKDGLATVPAFLEARDLARRGRRAEALAMLGAAPVAGIFGSMVAADVALEAGDPAAAEDYARRAVDAAPGYWESHEMLGRALEARGRLDDAEAAYRTAAGLDAAAAAPVVGLGRVAESRGAAARAAELYARARERRSASAEALWRLAALRIEAGDAKAGEALLSDLHADRLADPEAAIRLARAEAAVGRPERARARLAGALAARPEHPDLRALDASLRAGSR